jgi:hypothetical protein
MGNQETAPALRHRPASTAAQSIIRCSPEKVRR